MRIVHLSDIHLQSRYLKERPHRFLGKRLIGLLNLSIGGRHLLFRQGPEMVRQVFADVRLEHPDWVVVSGDLTALGFESEMRLAKELLLETVADPARLILVPGNHDLYTLEVHRNRTFHRLFREYMGSDLPEYCVPGEQFPFVRFLGDEVALVGVNSAKPNPIPWHSSGLVGRPQLERLTALLADERVRQRVVVVMTHFGPYLENGKPDSFLHGLLDREAFLTVLEEGRVGALLHGHLHHNYAIPADRHGFPIFCAGSTTYLGRAAFNVYEVQRHALQAEVHRYDPAAGHFIPSGPPIIAIQE